ncbi:hypothetical protein [Peribacillus muralis]|nr:hypothetical protein [Peribacillus muralis]
MDYKIRIYDLHTNKETIKVDNFEPKMLLKLLSKIINFKISKNMRM